jgi:hypothetical protein
MLWTYRRCFLLVDDIWGYQCGILHQLLQSIITGRWLMRDEKWPFSIDRWYLDLEGPEELTGMMFLRYGPSALRWVPLILTCLPLSRLLFQADCNV